MNKINKNYNSVLNTLEKQKAMFFIEEKLINALCKEFNLSQIRSPLISSKIFSTEISNYIRHRTINFDSIKNDGVYYVFNKYHYFLMNSLKVLDIENDKGVIVKTQYITRDTEITNTKTMEKNYLFLEIRYDNKNFIFNELDDYLERIHKIFSEIFKEFKEIFFNIKHKFPKNLHNLEIGQQKLQSDANIDFLVKKNTLKYGASKVIKYFDEEKKALYPFLDERNISLFYFLNNIEEPTKIVNGFIRKNINDLLQQSDTDTKLENLSENIKDEIIVAKSLLDKEVPSSFSIAINLDKLFMFFFDSAHILELQSGINKKEIEDYLKTRGIKHL